MAAALDRCNFQFPVLSAFRNCNREVTMETYSSQNAKSLDLVRFSDLKTPNRDINSVRSSVIFLTLSRA